MTALSYAQVEKLVLLDASVYAEGTEKMAKFPKFVSYAGVTFQHYGAIKAIAALGPNMVSLTFMKLFSLFA